MQVAAITMPLVLLLLNTYRLHDFEGFSGLSLCVQGRGPRSRPFQLSDPTAIV